MWRYDDKAWPFGCLPNTQHNHNDTYAPNLSIFTMILCIKIMQKNV